MKAHLYQSANDDKAEMLPLIQDVKAQNSSQQEDNLIESGIDVNAVNSDGKTPLYVAAECGHYDMVKLLLARGCNINQSCVNDETPLMTSARNHNNDVVKYLCDNDADVNKKSRMGETALYQACDTVNVAAVECLLARGADVNIHTNNFHPRTDHTPLMAALPSPYSINIQKKRKTDALTIVRLLLSHGCDVNARTWNGNTALHIAEEYHDAHTVCVLAESSAELHIKNKCGLTALEDAIQPNKQKYDVAFALLLYGYKIDEVETLEHPLITVLRGYNPKQCQFFPAKINLRHQLLLLLNELVTYDQDLTDKINETIASLPDSTKTQILSLLRLSRTKTPPSLKWTCRRVIRRTLRQNLLNKIWKLPIPTVSMEYLTVCLSNNRDPVKLLELLLAIEESNKDKVSSLIDLNLDINYSFVEQTPLTKAAKAGDAEMCKFLIQHGANVNTFDNTGFTPLHWAAFSGYATALEVIVQAGADMNSKTELGHEDALVISVAYGHFLCAMYLYKNGCDPDGQGQSIIQKVHEMLNLTIKDAFDNDGDE